MTCVTKSVLMWSLLGSQIHSLLGGSPDRDLTARLLWCVVTGAADSVNLNGQSGWEMLQ